MSRAVSGGRRRPTRATAVGGVLALAGFALTAIDWGFLVLVAIGTFGPGILRELGLLGDQDEFQRRAAHRAGYHAYLAGGFVAFLLAAIVRSGARVIEDAGELVTILLVVLWFTWFLSSLLSYWGARRTSSTLLMVFGSAWLIFNIIGNLKDPIAMLMQCLVAVPFFALAYVARRWPRVAGILLLGVAGALFWFFGLYEVFGTGPLDAGQPIVIVLFIGPLVASGAALLRRDDDFEVEAPDDPEVVQAIQEGEAP